MDKISKKKKKETSRINLKTAGLFLARAVQGVYNLFRNLLYKPVLPTPLEKVNMSPTKLDFLKKKNSR